MSKRVLTILLASLLAVGIFGAVAKAGVEGDFTFHIIMWPQGVQSEASKFDFDLEAVLNLDITISGLTLSNHLTMGIAGIENYVGSVQTILGMLLINDTFAFAKPYIGMYPGYWFPTKWVNPYYGNGYPIGNVLFVKKRAYVEGTVGGLIFSNLALFEDINFPAPWAYPAPPALRVTYGTEGTKTSTFTWTERTSYMPVIPGTSDETCLDEEFVATCRVTRGTGTIIGITKECVPGNPGYARFTVISSITGLDPGYHDAVVTCTLALPTGADYDASYVGLDQIFRFGDIIGISGTTVSGIKVTAKTGICADWRIRPAYYFFMGGKHYSYKQLEYAENVIKKYKWNESVCTNPKLEFTKEYLAIEGIKISDVLNLDVYSLVQFVPLNVFTAIEATAQLFGFGQLYLWMDLVTPKDLVIETGTPAGNPILILTLNPGVTLAWLDVNRSMFMDAPDIIILDSLITLQNANFANYITYLAGTGVTYMHNEVDIPISFPEPIGSLTIDTYWSRDTATGHLKFEDIDFGITKSFGEHNEFAFDVAFNEDGLYGADFSITVLFSL